MATNSDMLGLDNFIEQVLIKRFPSETWKHKVKRTDKGLRFHCPFCGDTYNPRANPRGNLYYRTKHYFCFNGGCFASYSLAKFVSKLSEEFDVDIDGIDLTAISSDNEVTTDNAYNRLILTKDNDIYNYVDDMGLLDYLPKTDDIIKLFCLKDVNLLPKDSKVRMFLEKRNAYQIPDLPKRVYSNMTDDKIFIMNVDDLSGKVLSYSSRDINKKSYIIQIYSDILKFWRPPIEVIEENVEFLDSISSYFNILNLDFSKPINIAEGQFDAMFLENYMALQGVSKVDFVTKHMQLSHINAFMDRDKAGYKTTFKLFDGYGIFLWTSVIEKLKKAFSDKINIINKIHDINELFSFLYNESGGTFTHKAFNDFIMKNVGDTVYDHLLI